MRRWVVGLLVLSLGGVVTTSAGASAADAHALTSMQQIDMDLAHEITLAGDRVYVTEHLGAVHAFDIGSGGRLRKSSLFHCDGVTDVAPLLRDRIAIALQWRGSACNVPSASRPTSVPGGVQIGHVGRGGVAHLGGSVAIPGGVHTLTAYPGSDLIYAAQGGGGLEAPLGTVESATLGTTYIIDASERDPQVVGTFRSLLNPAGCHDILFERMQGAIFGFCPGVGGTEIWDASDAHVPKPVGRLLLPTGQLPHQVAISSDGKIAAVSDEAWAAHVCRGGLPVGAIWFFDISDLKNPRLLGYYGPQRGRLPVGEMFALWVPCTAHNFNFIPKSRQLAISWITGGTNVIDISDPSAIKEIAHYRPNDATSMSAYWYKNRIYVADFERGVEVLRLDNYAEGR